MRQLPALLLTQHAAAAMRSRTVGLSRSRRRSRWAPLTTAHVIQQQRRGGRRAAAVSQTVSQTTSTSSGQRPPQQVYLWSRCCPARPGLLALSQRRVLTAGGHPGLRPSVIAAPPQRPSGSRHRSGAGTAVEQVSQWSRHRRGAPHRLAATTAAGRLQKPAVAAAWQHQCSRRALAGAPAPLNARSQCTRRPTPGVQAPLKQRSHQHRRPQTDWQASSRPQSQPT